MDRVNKLEKEIEELRKILTGKEKELYQLKKEAVQQQQASIITQEIDGQYHQFDVNVTKTQFGDKLPKWAIERYSRQILLSDIGVAGQEKICGAKVLIVGAGGLGCPAAMYLAGAGVGEIGIVDYDNVELTNIHRQLLHGESDQNMSKAESAAQSLRSINSRIKVTPYNIQLSSSNALEIASHYDLVLDCSDNVPTRYLLNDVCVFTKTPLISGSALKMEGQLTIYNYRSDKNPHEKESYLGPCYRCVFPTPPPAEAVGSCSANGVAGPVPGVIGCLQALEAIKCIVGRTHRQLLVERMLLFDGEDASFRTVRLRPRNLQCAACSDNPTISQLVDYEVFCKAQAKEKDLELSILPSSCRITPKQLPTPQLSDTNYQQRHLLVDVRSEPKFSMCWIGGTVNWPIDLELSILPPACRITPTQLAQLLKTLDVSDTNYEQRHLLVDVRSEPEFSMCRIDGAVNWPIEKLRGEKLNELLEEIRTRNGQVTFICRRGNDSQIAAKKILDLIEEQYRSKISDVTGGLHAWAQYVDEEFPIY